MVVVLSVAGRVNISYVGELYPFKTATQLANTAMEAPRLSRRPTPAAWPSSSPRHGLLAFCRPPLLADKRPSNLTDPWTALLPARDMVMGPEHPPIADRTDTGLGSCQLEWT